VSKNISSRSSDPQLEASKSEIFTWPEDPTPREAVDRLYTIGEDLATRQLPTDQIDELRDISRCLLRHSLVIVETLTDGQERVLERRVNAVAFLEVES